MDRTDGDVVILVPILARAHRVRPLLDSIRATTRGARVVFVCSAGDVAVQRAVDAVGSEQLTVADQRHGDYARKINAGCRLTAEPLIFTGADDLEFLPGWLAAARAAMTPGIGVVGTNDLGSPRVMRGEHATHFMVSRRYVERHGTIDERGKIFYEGYVHEYTDDEVVGTAIKRGAWAFAVDARVRHRHPDWDPTVPRDAMYAGQRQRMQASRSLYLSRRRLWM